MLASSPYNHPSEEEGARGRGDSPVDELLRTLGEGDRSVMEAGSKAYVSYIRAYKVSTGASLG